MNNEIDISPLDWQIVRRILQKYLPRETRLWTFGSRARGTARHFSDLDLAIDTGSTPFTLQMHAALADELEESDLPYRVDIVDLQRISGTFHAAIIEEMRSVRLFP